MTATGALERCEETIQMRALFPVFLLLTLGCGGAGGDRVDQAVTIARALRAAPDNAEKILEQNGMTPEQWEALMYEIAGDPALADRYETGLRQ